MRELVLGGDGLIGTEIVEQLRAKGHTVTSLDLHTGCDLWHVDITPFQECDRVWFLAWDVGGAKYIAATEHQHQLYKNNCTDGRRRRFAVMSLPTWYCPV